MTEPLSYTLVRFYKAPPALVYRLLTEPEHMNRWYAPKDFTIAESQMDFREGGNWSSVIRSPHGEDYRMTGVYRTIVPDENLAFSHQWIDDSGRPGNKTGINITLAEEGEGTRLTFRQDGFIDQATMDSNAEGWAEVFESLELYLQQLEERGE